ncbi:Protein_disulfide isomerase PDI3 [Hexamita inflata]|uniref:Protein disulfide isomerase PDI3 n=1 Tax=Hexamita inflata TaxID=28002 RepID=A0AA86UMF8_9EUKA|nr:Protein disulfide isomerase PDI3 [Hexamita inflata]
MIFLRTLQIVLDYTQDFEQQLTNKPTVIKYFTPWCGHSQILGPKFTLISSEFNDDVIFAEVNCQSNEKLCKDQKVRGYPTLSFYNEGKMIEKFSGAREISNIKQWITERLK